MLANPQANTMGIARRMGKAKCVHLISGYVILLRVLEVGLNKENLLTRHRTPVSVPRLGQGGKLPPETGGLGAR